jgi:hypothetical protein
VSRLRKLPATVRHDGPVQQVGRAVAALIACLALAGCSILSGRTTSTKTLPALPTPSSSTSTPAAQAAFTSPKAVEAVLAAAEHDFETIYTYDYRHLSRYRHAGLAVTTGSYSTTYAGALAGKPAQRLVTGQYVQVATAATSGLASLSGSSNAKVFIQGSLQITSADNPTGTTQSVAAVLTLKKSNRTWLVSAAATGAAAQGTIPANAMMRQAMTAARTTLELLYGLHRHGFKAQFQRLLDRTTDTLHDTLASRETALHKMLTDGKYDLSSKIVGFSVVSGGEQPEFVVAVDEYRNARQGARLGPYRHVFTVTATLRDSGWLLSAATPVS